MGYFVAAIFAYFRAKPFTHIFLACVFVALGVGLYVVSVQAEKDKAAALAAPPPAAVSLNDFTATDIHPASEVHVTGQINPAYNYELTEQRSGADKVRYMYVLFGPADTAETKLARAVVILQKDQLDAFTSQMIANFTDFTDMGPVFTLNGEATTSPDLKSMANDALAKEGLTKAPEFVFIEPWLKGRAAALAPSRLDALPVSAVVASPALLSLLLAFIGLGRGKAHARAATQMAAAPIPATLMGRPAPATRLNTATPATPMPAPVMATVTALTQGGSTFGKIALAYVAIFIGMFAGWNVAPVAFVLLTIFLIRRGAKVAMTAAASEAVNLGRNALQLAKSTQTAPPQPATYTPPPTPQPAPSAFTFAPRTPSPPSAPLPPAIRPGFSFRSLLPKRREAEPQENPYASLAASVRDERLRRGGA